MKEIMGFGGFNSTKKKSLLFSNKHTLMTSLIHE